MKHPLPRRLFLMLGLASFGWAVSAQADPYVITGGTTSVALDTELVADVAGLTLVGADGTVAPYSMDYDVGFAATGATNFTFAGDLSLIGGSIEHLGTLTFSDVDSVLHTVGNFSIRYDASRESALLSGLYLVDTFGGLGALFDLGVFDLPTVSGSSVWAGPTVLYIAPELGSVLLENEFTTQDPTGIAVGSAFFAGTVATATGVPDTASYAVTGFAFLALATAARVRRRFSAVA